MNDPRDLQWKLDIMGGASESGTVGYGGKERIKTQQTNLRVNVGKGTKHVNLFIKFNYIS